MLSLSLAPKAFVHSVTYCSNQLISAPVLALTDSVMHLVRFGLTIFSPEASPQAPSTGGHSHFPRSRCETCCQSLGRRAVIFAATWFRRSADAMTGYILIAQTLVSGSCWRQLCRLPSTNSRSSISVKSGTLFGKCSLSDLTWFIMSVSKTCSNCDSETALPTAHYSRSPTSNGGSRLITLSASRKSETKSSPGSITPSTCLQAACW